MWRQRKIKSTNQQQGFLVVVPVVILALVVVPYYTITYNAQPCRERSFSSTETGRKAEEGSGVEVNTGMEKYEEGNMEMENDGEGNS